MRHRLGLIGGLALWAGPALASQMNVTPAQLCSVSDAVVVAYVTDIETRWSADQPDGGIERVAFLSIQDTVTGAIDDDQVVLPGGAIGDISQWVEDVPKLMVNAQYLLFTAETNGQHRIVGGNQGAVRILPQTSGRGTTLDRALAAVEVCRVD